MPLDHYIPQVHLKNFYSQELGNGMYVIRKNDQKQFIQSAKNVCRLEEGNTNHYLKDKRIIEEFLKGVEPKYNKSIDAAIRGEFSDESIYVIAGFISYVMTCSPAAMRIHSRLFRSCCEEAGRLLDHYKELPTPPLEMGGVSFTDLLEKKRIAVKIDEKYPQAVGISTVLSKVKRFGNSHWQLLYNEHAENPFFTSDYPIAIESSSCAKTIKWIVPLTPYLAIKIAPNTVDQNEDLDFSFSQFSCEKKSPSRFEIRRINQLIVRCAESLVFFNKLNEWNPRFVRRNSQYRIEMKASRHPHRNGVFLYHAQEIVKTISQ